MGRRKAAAEPDDQEIEIELFLLGLLRKYGYDFRGHDPDFVRAHVRRRVKEEELDSVSQLTERLLRDHEVLERFLMQTSEGNGVLFGPADFWKAFRKDVVPFLRTYPSVRLWHLGGPPEDLYTLAILLHEDLPRQVQIYATDIHEALLDPARMGVLEAEKITDGAREYRRSGGRRNFKAHFQMRNGSAVFSDDLRGRIYFSAHNPVTDGAFQRCHAILARHVLGACKNELRARTLRLFHDSLVPLGFLALDPKDILQESPVKNSYREIDKSAGLFQKVRE
jgi:chemotaxis protein methyltransferase CheR